MSKTPAQIPQAADAEAAPKKRSRLKLALLAVVPLALAGGGYAGWTMFFAEPAEAAAGDDHGPDAVKVAAIPPEVAAESSFTHAFALGVLTAARCGPVETPALQAASEAEAVAEPKLVNLSWIAAVRRTASISQKTCDYTRSEVNAAEKKAKVAAAEKGGAHKPAAAAHH